MNGIALLLGAVLLVTVQADVYLGYPRGSNNRLNEASRTRDTDDRVFDSQNNQRGGSNVGSTYYYTGSVMNMEWTNQHSCGHPNTGCELIVQYMCDDLLRDGTTTDRIPENTDKGVKYGRHESWSWYSKECKYRSRNKGLFTANRHLDGSGAIYTRQNENGDRYGYECPEERDYYPYWHPTPWRDVAILTNHPDRCPSYRALSQNVAPRYYCEVPPNWLQQAITNGRADGRIPINETECRAIISVNDLDPITNTSMRGKWTLREPWGLPEPFCQDAARTRDNHLGNIDGGEPFTFNWTLPESFTHERCVMRLRYNITSADYSAWASASSVEPPANLTNRNNTDPTPGNNNAGNENRYPAKIDVWSRYGLAYQEVANSLNPTTNDRDGNAIKSSRDYVWKNNPRVDIFGDALIPRAQSGDATNTPAMIRLQLAINTNQFGRTFQDRSHTFYIRRRTAAMGATTRIVNVAVRGKRGNIVQTYPAHEYDFQPNRVHITAGTDLIHLQWTGSNTHNNGPNANDAGDGQGGDAGEGTTGTDRHNFVQIADLDLNMPLPLDKYQSQSFFTNLNCYKLDGTAIGVTGNGQLNKDCALWLATSGFYRQTTAVEGFTTNNDRLSVTLDNAPPSLVGGVVLKSNTPGSYNYISTRNNNFSNRSQKGTIVVDAVVIPPA